MDQPIVARFSFAIMVVSLAPLTLRAEPSWRPMEPTSRNLSAMAYDAGRGVCVLFGGQDDLRTFRGLSDTWEWDGARWRERAFTRRPAARAAHAMAYDETRGCIVLFGGVLPSNELLGDTWTYNGSKWTLASESGPPAQGHHVMVYDDAEQVVVLVGAGGVWTWDGRDWTQRSADVPRFNSKPTAAFDRERKVVVVFARSDFDRTTFEWNGISWIDRTTNIGPRTDRPVAMTVDADRRVTVLTGVSAGPLPLYETWEWDGDTWLRVSESKTDPAPSDTLAYDSARGVTVSHSTHTSECDGALWTPRGPGPRMLHAMTYDPARQEVLVFGGARVADTGSGNVYFNDLWGLTREGWKRHEAVGPAPRYGPSMAYDEARDVVVLFGGRDATRVPIDDTWEWDGEQWTLVATDGPAGVSYSSMAYDSTRGVMVLHVDDAFTNNSPQFETWEWDGLQWSQRDRAVGEDREFAKLVYDARIGRTLAYGLESRSVWEWDGHAWLEQPSAGPLMRQLHSMVFDKERGLTVTLDAGSFPALIPRTWSWDGASWETTTSNVAPRTHAAGAMAYDAGRRLAVYHGGYEARMFGDTWVLAEDLAGDVDRDGDVDLSDLSTFTRCFNGAGAPPAGDCPEDARADLDGDRDVDLADFWSFAENFTGSR